MTVPFDDDLTSRRWRFGVVGIVLMLLAVVFGLMVALEEQLHIDQWWNGFVDTFAFLQPAALVMNFIGGGWFATFAVPLGFVGIMLVLRRPWGALFVVAASGVSVAFVQLIKALFGRARPEDILVVSDHGSYPSGHVANAATIAAIAVVLFPRVWVVVIGALWTVTMAVSRTQLHAHWATDTIGGALAGIGATLLVAAAFTVVLQRERAQQNPRERSLGWAA